MIYTSSDSHYSREEDYFQGNSLMHLVFNYSERLKKLIAGPNLSIILCHHMLVFQPAGWFFVSSCFALHVSRKELSQKHQATQLQYIMFFTTTTILVIFTVTKLLHFFILFAILYIVLRQVFLINHTPTC